MHPMFHVIVVVNTRNKIANLEAQAKPSNTRQRNKEATTAKVNDSPKTQTLKPLTLRPERKKH